MRALDAGPGQRPVTTVSRVASSERGRFGATRGTATTLILRTLFAVAYLSLILSTVLAVKLSESLSLLFFVSRSAALIGILAIWAYTSAYTERANRIVAIFSLVFLPYIFTSAYLAYLDVLVILILATNFQRSVSIEKYYVRLAYASLALVLVIALLAWSSVIPMATFTWEDRVKNSLGFSNPNTFYFFVFSSAMVFFLFKRRVAFFLTGVAMLGLFPLVGSRTFMGTYVLLAGIWIWPSLIRYRLFILTLWVWLAAVTALGLMTIVFPAEAALLLNAVLQLDANELFSNRLNLAEQAMASDTVQLLLGGLVNTTDSLYAYFMNGFGLAGLFVFLFWAWISVARQVHRGRPIALAIAAIYFTVGLVEVPFDGSALIAIVFFSEAFFNLERQPVPIV